MPTFPQNGGMDICFMRFPLLDEKSANIQKMHFLDRFEPLFFEHGPKNCNAKRGVIFEV